ncbi:MULTISPECIES: DUF3942 family protein [Bacillus cereus group]|uniref:DUF3942 family protein n=1 Tax=Bacillus cereus group TaxID=86661 RepID=UPI00077A8E4C|nr:DUF3942 family protein [Bacillus cereus]KXY95819.1 hypothetical protein AT279_01000 [Bacillus cereus]MCU5351857.1 DUF3942 family protein [Bacillus cereus]MDK7408542.1 DUF3942 family protein [Bacillus cereus]MDK7413948.1 DUF3942 family protein [Bacillus cereus]MEC0007408.1 DUF3942 family protein [Bacillus cereus]
MNKLDNFIERTKAYIVADVEEKLVREKFNEQILPSMRKIQNHLDSVEGYDYEINMNELIAILKIHDKQFSISINSIGNFILVQATNHENLYVEVDKIILQEENLFSTKRKQVFNEDILVDYLNETFESIIGK